MIKVGINGFGRIGRAIFKNASLFNDIDIVAINDINPEIQNLGYLLKFDSYYGRFDKKIEIIDSKIIVNGKPVNVYNEKQIKDVPWLESGCDLIIEATGVHSHLDDLPSMINKGIKKIVVTYSPDDKVDSYIVLGANENQYKSTEHIKSLMIYLEYLSENLNQN